MTTEPLTVESLKKEANKLMTLTDPEGHPLGLVPNKLLVGLDLKDTALRLLQPSRQTSVVLESVQEPNPENTVVVKTIPAGPAAYTGFQVVVQPNFKPGEWHLECSTTESIQKEFQKKLSGTKIEMDWVTYYTPKQFAALVQVSSKTVYTWLKKVPCGLPDGWSAIKLGKRVRIIKERV